MLQFGQPIPGARHRPGAYAVIHDAARGLAVVRTDGPFHLPGGGIEPGEDDAQAVVREVSEETGLVIAVVERIGVVQQAVGRLNKQSHYLWCRILGEGAPTELDHELGFLSWREAMHTLQLGADRWAVTTWAVGRGYDIE